MSKKKVSFCRKKNLAYTFNYIYTCDIEDILFRVKIVNLDGILPPSSSHLNDPHNKNGTPTFSKYSTVQNYYEYNIVENNNFSSIDLGELMSSDDEESSGQDTEPNGIESDENRNMTGDYYISSFLHPSNSIILNHGTKSKQKKKKKLKEIIFGNLNQPFRALSSHPYLTCDLVSSGRRLSPPQQTQYKQMNNRYEWNEWIVFSLTLDTLPRDTMVCFTVWDTIAPGKTCAVARTSISLFSKRGCMRKGFYDLRLFFDEDCEEYFNKNHNKITNSKIGFNNQQTSLLSSSNTEITLSDVNFSNRKHRKEELVLPERDMISKLRKHLNLTQSKDSQKSYSYKNKMFLENFDVESLEFSSMTEYYQQDLSFYPIGSCDKSKKIQQLNKLRKSYHNNQMPKLDWLDRLTFLQIERAMVKDKSLSTHVFLTVEFPTIMMDGIEHTAVYFEDKDDQCCQYDIVDKDIVTIPDPEINLPNLVEIKHHALSRSARSGISLRDLKPNATIRNQLNAIVNYPPTHQLSNEEQDLIWKFRFYLRNQKKALAKFLKTVNWNSVSEAEQAIDLMNEWTPMDIEDALELLSPFFTHPAVRKYAVGRLKESLDDDLLLYLLQLVQALKYENFQEIHQSFENELLEYQQQAHHTPQITKEMKSYSESTTAEASLPESIKIFASTPNPTDMIDPQTLPTKSPNNEDSSSNNDDKHQNSPINNNQEDLATFLLNRACQNNELANYFFWYLCVECEDAKSLGCSLSNSEITKPLSANNPSTFPNVISSAATTSYLIPPLPPINEWEYKKQKSKQFTPSELSSSYSVNNVIDMYMIMMKRFSTRLLCGTPEMTARRDFLLRQQDFVVKLVEIMKEIARESGNRLKKIEKLQSILESPEPQYRFNFNKNDPLPSPLNPNIKIVGVASKEATLYKSATMPAKIGFLTNEGNVFYTIFKNGDDLRQDDLVLQMINLMDKLLRKENLDLKLTTYRVLACSSKHGFVEFIDSQSVADVISNEGSIQNYLKKISQQSSQQYNTPTITSIHDFQVVTTGHPKHKRSSPLLSPQVSGSSASGGVSPEIMNSYIKSCAGYCVITYLLGVGDRHLDNLMLTKTGRLFHIDFGFILGRDPKVRPPPMKITREMVDAMGGMDSDNFSKFCSLVRTAFLHLRRHANLILNLFSLMVDANVPDIALEPDKTVQKVQDKFKLELDDEQADHYITEQVEQSVRSIMPVVVDQLHKMTQYLRN